MRTLIIAALLMSPIVSAPLNAADNTLQNKATPQPEFFLSKAVPAENSAAEMNTVLTRSPETRSSDTKAATQSKTKQADKTKKTRVSKAKKVNKGMNFLSVLLLLKDAKK